MVADPRSPWSPGWAVVPGEVLEEALEDREMSQAELARRTGRPMKTISEIVNGKASITPDTAIQLERALGISASFWNGLEARYRETLARERAHRDLETHVSWLDHFPIREMVGLGVLPARESNVATVGDLLSFFGVASPSAWERHWQRPSASFRVPQSQQSSTYAMAAWLRWGEKEALKIEANSFDEATFREALQNARPLTRLLALDIAMSRLRTLCAAAGVVVLVIPEIPGARVSGATRWLRRDRAFIQISRRYLSDDQFWYSFFHEAGHVVEGRRADVVEDIELGQPSQDDEGERAANAFARDALIPPADYQRLLAKSELTPRLIQEFAAELRVSAGVVVGRLQHDGQVPYSRLNELKRHYEA
jgi:HTH-type transcriptional regulator/antitoxin HigA